MDLEFYDHTSTGAGRLLVPVQRAARWLLRPMFRRLRDVLAGLDDGQQAHAAQLAALTARAEALEAALAAGPPPPPPPLRPGQPPRLGVWLDYDGTLRPDEGIGVHVHSLLGGFLARPEPVELVLLGRAGQEDVLAPLVKAGGGRVTVLSPPAPFAGGLAAEAAGCHLWVLPYVGTAVPLRVPTAVILHDLVQLVHPEAFDPAFLVNHRRVADRVLAAARVVVCLTDALADREARGLLGLPADRVRVIRPAATALPPDPTPPDPAALAQAGTGFLFYPGAVRGYKNHAALVAALAVLRDQHGRPGLRAVFTGADPDLPAELAAAAAAAGVGPQVVAVGRVNRATLDELYRRAAALVFPSRYEGCGLPVYEALALGCPVACSDLPVFREQLAPLGDAVRYFDPDRPDDLARAVDDLLAHRPKVLAAQQAARGAVLGRTWADVAGDWLALVRELTPAA